MSVRILTGDCRDMLATLPAESVQCVVTSPPYWGLRDYGVDGQLGLERTLGEHLDALVAVFRDVRRVLRKDGTLWLNYGDCYASSPNGRSAADTKAAGNDDRTFRDKPFSTVGPICVPASESDKRRGRNGKESYRGAESNAARMNAGGFLKPKDLCMIPHRLAIALQDDGWWVRSDIVWAKPNPMPESISDRPTRAHEYVFLLTRSARYFYNAGAIKEPAVYFGLANQDESGFKNPQLFEGKHKDGYRSSKPKGNANGFRGGCYVGGNPGRRTETGNVPNLIGTRNARSVWEIATAPFSEAHFATFPPQLAERCILAGTEAGALVLDPFGGAGTVGLVADRLQRDAILIELNPEYAAMAEFRIRGDAPMLAEVSV